MAARGAAVLLGIRVMLYGGALIQSVVVARWIPPAAVGTYALGVAIVTIVGRIKHVGAPEKLVRDSESDFAVTFPAAFAAQLWLSAVAFAVLAALLLMLPEDLVDPQLAWVTVALGFTLFQQPAELPAVAFFRRSEFAIPGLRQILASAAALLATTSLAVAGWGVWALVLGQLIGVFATATLFWGFMPRALPLRPVLPTAVRDYVTFGLPIWAMGLLAVATERGTTLAISSALGLTVLGYVHIAQSLGNRLAQASQALSSAILPVLRTVGEDPERMRSVIGESNRIFALGAVPVGAALALFSPDFVPLLFGERWAPATPFVAMSCLAWGFGMIGYASYLPFLVRGETRVPALFGSSNLVVKFVLTVTALYFFAVEGFLVAMAIGILIAIHAQTEMLRQMFPMVSLLENVARTIFITAIGIAVVRVLDTTTGAGDEALVVRLLAYGATIAAGTFCFDQPLLRKAVSAFVDGTGVRGRGKRRGCAAGLRGPRI